MPLIKTETNFGNRIPATIIDLTLFYVFFFTYAYTYGEPDDGGYTVSGFAALGVPAIWFLYFPLTEALGGQTLGHKLMGIKVVSKSGKPITFSQAIRRRVCDIFDLHFFFGLIGFLVVRSSPDNQRLGDMWAGTIVVGGLKRYCQNCHEKLVLSPKEHVTGKFDCSECNSLNYLPREGSLAGGSHSMEMHITGVLKNLPQTYHKHQQIIIAKNYLQHAEWALALESIVEMANKTGHLFSQEFWMDLKDIAQNLNQPKIAEHCHEQMLHTTREYKGVIEKGNTVAKTKDGSFIYHKV